MRTMINVVNGTKLNITEWFMLKNNWEYYVTDINDGDESPNEEDKNIKCCYVLGFEEELGDVYIPEVAPYIIAKTKDLKNIMPAPEWKWE